MGLSGSVVSWGYGGDMGWFLIPVGTYEIPYFQTKIIDTETLINSV